MRPLLRLPAVALAAAMFVSASLAPTLLAQTPVISATKSDGVPAATKVLPGATVTYTNTIANSGAAAASGVTYTDPDVANTTMVPGSVHISPLAINDSYQTLANTTLNAAEPGGPAVQISFATTLRANDVTLNAPGGTDTTTIVSHTAPANGTLLSFDNSDGSFAYVPNAGFVGTDTFTYTVQNNADVTLTDTATVTITVLDSNPAVGGNQKIWYVQNNATVGGLGRSQDPFDTLVEAQTASAAGDTIYVFQGSGLTTGQTAGFILKDSQRLLGEGVALSVPVAVNGGSNPTVLRSAGTAPSISNAAGAGVAALNLSSIEIRGLNISTTGAGNNAVDIQTTGANNGSAEVANNTITGAGANGIDFNGNSTGTLNVSVHDNTVTATTNGIEIQRIAGAVYITAFDDNVISGDTGAVGIFVNTATFDATPGGPYQQVSGGVTTVGTSGNTVGSSALELSNVSGDLAFTDLDAYAVGTGLGLDGTGLVNVGAGTGTRLTVPTGVATFVSTSNAAVFALDATIDIQSALVTSSNSIRQGVYLAAIGTGTTASTFSASSGSSITSASLADFDTSASNANITYNGTITDDLGALVTVVNNTGGTVAFTGAITDGNDGDGNGITLTGNTGATINFSGGLTLSTGPNPAFTGTGGGTVNVTGSANTIATTTATALNVANTTIGASHLTFRTISSSGGSATGIILDTTGSTGGLRVVGTGSAGTGGIIANKTGADGAFTSGNGIYLNNTIDVRLAWMQLNDFQNSAIRGFGVTGFSLTNSVISGTNGTNTAEIEGAIAFGHVGPTTQNGLFGSSLIDNVNISGSIEHHLEFYNQSGTMNLTITNSNIHDNSVAGGSDGIQMDFAGTAQAFINISNNTFTNNKSQAIQIAANGGSNIHATIRANTIPRGTQGNEGIILSNGSNGDLTAMIGGPGVGDGNTITGFGGTGIFVGQTAGNATNQSLLHASIIGNTVTSPTTATNHSIIAFMTSTVGQISQARLLIHDNTVTQNSTAGIARGILVDTPDTTTSPEFHATVTKNRVAVGDNVGGVAGLVIQARQSSIGHFRVGKEAAGDTDANVVTFPNGAPAGIQGLRVRQVAPATAELEPGTSGGTSLTALTANNPGSTVEVLGTVTLAANNNVVQSPTSPTAPAVPLLFAPGEVDTIDLGTPDSVESAIAWTKTVRNSMNRSQPAAVSTSASATSTLTVQDAPVASVPESSAALTQSNLDRIVAAARAHWEATGLTPQQKAQLNSLTFQVTDLPGWYLGENDNGLIRVDADAGGNGWFIDTTPSDNSEFSGSGPSTINSQLSTSATSRIDLLTTVLHEMGHSLGLCDTYSKLQRNSVMYGFLTKGERRLPVQGQATGAVPHEHATPHHLSAPVTIGTLPAGKSITIKYAVVVNDPPLSGTLTSQATVSGSNFANVLTDDLVTGGDPLLPGAADPTVTQVDLPDVAVSVSPASQLENSGSPLTYTFARAGNTTSALTVNFTVTGTASASDFAFAGPSGSTYSAGTGTVVIGVGDSSASITLTPSGDTTVEPDETVIVSVASAATYDIGVPASATATITNDDADIAVTVAGSPATEGGPGAATGLTYTFTRTGYTGVAVTANFTVGGTASLGGSAPDNDYTASGAATFTSTAGTVSFAIGDATKVVIVTPVTDAIDEIDETVVLTMASGTGYNASGTAATGTIADDDLPPVVSITAPSAVAEGDSGTTTLGFTVNLTTASAKTITVNYATSNGTATTAGTDYVATSGTLTFAPGETSKPVNVTVNGDTLNEANETLSVTLSTQTNSTLGTATATGTINNDDPVPTLAINDVTLAEGNAGTTSFAFTVTLGAASGQTATVNYATADGTAVAPGDYTTASGTLTFAPGDLTKTITVLVNGDTTSEGSETFLVNLTTPTNATIADGQGTGTITDDDLPQVSVNTVALGDNDAVEGGSNNGLFTFTRTSTLGALTANFQLDASSTGVAGTDFTLTGATTFNNATGAGTIAFANGVGTATVTLTALTESPNPAEAAETARLNIVASPGVYVVGASPNATITIAENSFLVTTMADDGTGSLRLAVQNANSIAGANTITFAGATFTDATPDTIIIASSPLFFTSEITLEGPTAAPLSLDGGGTQLVMISTAADAVPLLVKDIIITNGFQSVNISGGFVNTTTSAATTTFLRCQFVNNIGAGAGAITNISGTLNLVNCVVANNTATTTFAGAGGGIANGAPLNLINTTVSGNSVPNAAADAAHVAGGIATGVGALTITNSTITNNSVGTAGNTSGLAQFSGTVTVSNSIIAGNVSNTTNPDLTGAFTSNGGNVIGNRGTATGFAQGVINDQVGTAGTPVNALLGPLANNGGTTLTHALLTGSPALNNGFTANLPLDTFDADGDSNTAETLDVDQRGATFIRSIGNPDSGAFELQKSVSILADAASKNEGASGTTNFTFTVSRTGGTVGAVAMTYTISGAAVNGTDFVGATLPTGTVTIADGLSTATVTIPVSGDTEVEPGEAFTVTLTSPDNGYVVSGAPATSTITNDDTATVTIATAGNGTEGTSSGSFLLTQTALSSVDTVVNFTPTGSAISGTDFTALGATATIPAGSLTATVTVLITDDRLVEGPENVIATLTGVASGNPGVTLGATLAATVSIADNDTATLGYTAGTSTALESVVTQNISTTLTISATGAGNIGLAGDLTANLTTTGGTASGSGTDYTLPASPALTFPAGTYATGTATQNGTITVIDDRLVEGDETAALGLSIVSNIGTQVSLGGTTAHTLTLADNDTAILGYTAGTSTALESVVTQNVSTTLTISATGAGNIGLAGSLTANLTTTGGTATGSGTDYTLPASPALTFPAGTYATGTATQNGTITVIDDRLVEGNETAALGLSIVSNIGTQVSLGGTTAHTLTITDNDTATLSFFTASSTVLESAGTQDVTATLTINATGAGTIGLASNLTANLTTTGGTASGSDFTLPGTPALTFASDTYASGIVVKTAVVTIATDSIVEANETVDLGLSIVTNIGTQVSLGGTTAHTVTITDDDTATITLSPGSLALNEGTGGGPTTFTFTATAGSAVQGGFTVAYTSADGTATAGSDYTATSGTLTFAGNAGETHTITVPVTHDGTNELDETFTVALGAFSNTTLGASLSTAGSPATATILNDDLLSVSIAATDSTADENTAGTGTWRITRNGVVGSTTVQLQIDATSTALAADWSQSGASLASLAPGSTGTAVIPAGSTSVDIILTPQADIHAEADESIILNINTDAAYVIGTSPATITIGANDFVVINGDDAGEGSLRQAVANANAFSSDDVISFTAPQNVVLTTGELAVAANGTLSIQGDGTSISGNSTSRVFQVASSASLTLRRVTIQSGVATNASGGGIYNAGTLTVIESTFSACSVTGFMSGGFGAAIYNTGTLNVAASTFVANTAQSDGGAIQNDNGSMSVVNSTFSGNTCQQNGGAVGANFGTVSIFNSTFTANQARFGGGVFFANGTHTLTNCIVAGNTSVESLGHDVYAFADSSATSFNNLIGTPLHTGFVVNGTNGNQVGTAGSPIDAKLGALANNGGPTFTHALLDGSPAINAGDTASLPADTYDLDGNSNTAETLPVDQRGATFARVIGSIVDIGAYEAFAFRPAITASTTNEDTQSTTGLVITPNTADGGLTTAFKITNIVGGTLFKADGTTAITAGTFLTLPEGAAGLKFTPSLNLNSPATTFGFDAQATVDGADSGLRTGLATAVITVTPVNDAPTVVLPGLADQTLLVTETRSVALPPAFADVDLDTLTFSVQSNSNVSRASATINGTNVDLVGLAPGITDITILASDGNTGTVTDTFRILVGTPNPTPGPVPPPPGPGGYKVTAQTGLFTLTIPVTNTTAASINGFRLSVDISAYLAAYPSLRLYNSSSAPGVTPPYIDFPYPMAVNDVVNVELNFYTSTRTFPNPFAPVLTVTTLGASDTAGPAGPGVEATIRVPAAGRVILEWATIPGRWYRVQYTDNLGNPNSWFYSPIPLQATGTRMQWIDTGAPFTSSPPAGARFYRVNEIPAPVAPPAP